MAANPDNNFSKMEEKVDGKIYNEKGDVLNLSYIEFKSSCTHASGNRVTDTVWQHRHTGSRCDVYKANATWCKKCNTILKYNSAWVYSYTHITDVTNKYLRIFPGGENRIILFI